jgi:ElaB/YqjD/DUF883 family membrane-anchored ribosome-binding protein
LSPAPLSPETPPVLSRALYALALYTFAAWLVIGTSLLMWVPGRGAAAGMVSRLSSVLGGASSSVAIAPLALGEVFLASTDEDSAVHGFVDESDGDFSWGLTGDDDQVWVGGPGWRSKQRELAQGPPRFWFREDGREYAVTDPAIVTQVRDAVRPLHETGKEMGVVGGEMGRNGARMGRIGGRLGAASARIAILQARAARRSARDHDRADVDERMKELRAEIAELSAQLEQEHAAQGSQQQELSRRMSELSAKHHDILKQVRQKVREIATRARREGKAERPHANA